MVGYISTAVAVELHKWAKLKEANIIPVRSTEGTTVVTTPLPAIVIHVVGELGEGGTFIGGAIRQYFELQLITLVPLTNFTFSPDKGKQSSLLDVSDEVIRCIECDTALIETKQKHDLNLLFERTETETTYGTFGSVSVTVDVIKNIWKGSVVFDMGVMKEEYEKLQEVLIRLVGTNIQIKVP